MCLVLWSASLLTAAAARRDDGNLSYAIAFQIRGTSPGDTATVSALTVVLSAANNFIATATVPAAEVLSTARIAGATSAQATLRVRTDSPIQATYVTMRVDYIDEPPMHATAKAIGMSTLRCIHVKPLHAPCRRMREFAFFGTWNDSWAVLDAIEQLGMFSIVPDLCYERPEPLVYQHVGATLRARLRAGLDWRLRDSVAGSGFDNWDNRNSPG